MILYILAILQAIMAIGAIPVINGNIRDRHVNAAWGSLIAGIIFAVTAYALVIEAMQ